MILLFASVVNWGIIVAAGTSAWNFANKSLDEVSDLYKPYLEAWKNYTKNTVVLMGDVEHSKTLDEEQMNKSIQTKGLPTLLKYPGHENDTEIVADKEYGSFEDGNGYAFIVEPGRIHEAAFVSTTTVGNLLYYGQLTVDEVPNYIDSTDQIWPLSSSVWVGAPCSFRQTSQEPIFTLGSLASRRCLLAS